MPATSTAANSACPSSVGIGTLIEASASHNSAPSHGSSVIKYNPWKLHTQITLQRSRTPSVPSQPDLATHIRPVQHPDFTSVPPGSTVQIKLYIERLLSHTVAVVADCDSISPARWVVKFYPSDRASLWHLNNELTAYAACQALQGAEVALFYGQWSIDAFPAHSCCALLMELVVPGTTIVELRDAGLLEEEEGDLVAGAARGKRAWLQTAVVMAVARINACGVVHQNLGSENIVVVAGEGGDGVVILDFGWSTVEAEEGFRTGDKWSLFQMGWLT